jgi:hypothetical protein
MARPVVGGHFAFLALERACGGKAVDGLKFLDEEQTIEDVDVAAALFHDLSQDDNVRDPWPGQWPMGDL